MLKFNGVSGNKILMNGEEIRCRYNDRDIESGIPTEGLVLWADGNDFANVPSSSWKDRSGFSNNLTPVNMGYTTTSGSDGARGVVFDGVNDYMNSPINSDFNLLNLDFTIYTRFKFLSIPTDYAGIIGKRISGTTEISYYLRYNVTSNRFEIKCSTNGISTDITLYFTFTPIVGEYIDLAMIRRGTNLIMWINGVEVAVNTYMSDKTLFSSNSPLTIGAFKNGTSSSYTYYGNLEYENVLVYKGKALNVFELNSITNYYSGLPPIETSYVTAVYLTLDQDAINKGSESMYVHYHVLKEHESNIYYKKTTDVEWLSATATITEFQNEPLNVCHTHLYGLQADTEYIFRIGQSDINGEYKFLTLPSTLDGTTFKGAFGSDMQSDFNKCANMTNIIGINDCRFFVMSGDWADDNATLSYSYRWKDLLNAILPVLKDTQGRLIPIMAGLGNHEVTNYYGTPPMNRPFAMDIFGFKDKAYNVVDFGNYLSLVMLDTEVGTIPSWATRAGYTVATQTQWLQNILPARIDKKFVIPAYHSPKYPANTGSIKNDAWVSQFEQNGIKACFESHDHVRKKTFKIKNGILADDGITYFGGATMGAKYYPGDNVGLWYIDEYNKDASYVNIVEFSATKMTVRVTDSSNQVISATDILATDASNIIY